MNVRTITKLFQISDKTDSKEQDGPYKNILALLETSIVLLFNNDTYDVFVAVETCLRRMLIFLMCYALELG